MRDDPAQTVPRWSIAKIALAVSLALNLLIVGLVAGAFFGRGDDPTGRRGPLRDIGNAPFVRALDDAHRRAMVSALRDEGVALRESRAVLRSRFQALVAALRVDPFEPDALQALFDGQRQAASAHQQLGEALILQRLQDMSAAERAAYADRLVEALRRGGRRR